MKTIYLNYLCVLALLLTVVSCHEGGDAVDEGRDYSVHATVDVDSTVVLDHMVLYADGHASMHEDSLFLSPEHTFEVSRRTLSLDELYLCSDSGELCRFFAAGGMTVQLSLSGRADSLVAHFDDALGDTINPWLQQHIAELDGWKAEQRREVMDSLCHTMPGDLRCALLLRDQVLDLQDSLFVRRCLGALTPEVKPEWLLQSIDVLLAGVSPMSDRMRRLPTSTFVINDSTTYDMQASRVNHLLVYCWADYDQASVDSLQVLFDLVDDEYDMKRLQFLSCCLHAADSASWMEQVEDVMDVYNVWLPAGLADQRVRAWNVQRVPTLFLLDAYNNIQQRNVWGKDLRNALSRVPNRSGFAHTPKTKPHGR